MKSPKNIQLCFWNPRNIQLCFCDCLLFSFRDFWGFMRREVMFVNFCGFWIYRERTLHWLVLLCFVLVFRWNTLHWLVFDVCVPDCRPGFALWHSDYSELCHSCWNCVHFAIDIAKFRNNILSEFNTVLYRFLLTTHPILFYIFFHYWIQWFDLSIFITMPWSADNWFAPSANSSELCYNN